MLSWAGRVVADTHISRSRIPAATSGRVLRTVLASGMALRAAASSCIARPRRNVPSISRAAEPADSSCGPIPTTRTGAQAAGARRTRSYFDCQACAWRVTGPGSDGLIVRIEERAQRDGRIFYAVVKDGWVANEDREWEYEPRTRTHAQTEWRPKSSGYGLH
jgi:hypothetical protein